MKQVTKLAGGVLLALGCASLAQAHVIDPGVDKALKPAAKLRADIGNQVAKYTFCLVKATTKCESKGVMSGPECNLATGDVAYEPDGGKNTDKFQAAIAKCDTKINLSKKAAKVTSGEPYEAIGCPGDCDSDAPGLQQCSSIQEFQDTVISATGVKGQLGLLLVALDAACAGQGDPSSEARMECVENAAKGLVKYAQGLFKCQNKCENDYKGKKGGGGPDNSDRCLATSADPDPAFDACRDKSETKAKLTGQAAALVPVVNAVIGDASNGLYNRSVPGGSPADNPCGTCGDGVREGTEECDGADLGTCGACAADCSCQ